MLKDMLRYGFILTLICSTAALALAGVNSVTKSKIAAQSLKEEEASLKEVMPQAASFEAVKAKEEVIYYKACDLKGNVIGVVFKAFGKGYSSTIETMAAMKTDGTIVDIKILNQSETPGLGSRVKDASFTDQFGNKNIDNLDVQAITGATISSRTVIDSVKKKAQEIVVILQNERD